MEEGTLPDEDEATPSLVPAEVITKIAACLEELRKCMEEAPHTTVSGSVDILSSCI